MSAEAVSELACFACMGPAAAATCSAKQHARVRLLRALPLRPQGRADILEQHHLQVVATLRCVLHRGLSGEPRWRSGAGNAASSCRSFQQAHCQVYLALACRAGAPSDPPSDPRRCAVCRADPVPAERVCWHGLRDAVCGDGAAAGLRLLDYQERQRQAARGPAVGNPRDGDRPDRVVLPDPPRECASAPGW